MCVHLCTYTLVYRSVQLCTSVSVYQADIAHSAKGYESEDENAGRKRQRASDDRPPSKTTMYSKQVCLHFLRNDCVTSCNPGIMFEEVIHRFIEIYIRDTLCIYVKICHTVVHIYACMSVHKCILHFSARHFLNKKVARKTWMHLKMPFTL